MSRFVRTPGIIIGALLACSSAGCIDGEEPLIHGDVDAGALATTLDAGSFAAVVPADGGAVATPVSALDLLLVVDNSGSMASKQQRLQRELARIVHMLTSGDRYAGREDQVPAGLSDKARRFTPVTSMHIGVVSSNVGGIDNPTPRAPILACAGNGDDGKLQHDTTIAVAGVIAGQNEFLGFRQGDVVIAAEPTCALPTQPAYQEYWSSDDPSAVANAALCVAHLGVRGCPFEQPLESMWQALAPSQGAPSTPLYTFLNGHLGQGDRANQGFLRSDAALAVVILSDEDDCAITQQGKVLFTLGGAEGADADARFGPLNLRCGLLADNSNLVQPIDRFLDGLLSLKPGHPERIVLTEVVGVPIDAVSSGASYDELLARPEMHFQEDPLQPGFPMAACSNRSNADEVAYPARRYVQLAKQLGPQVVLESICQDSYGDALNRMVDKIAPLLGQ